MSQEFFFLIAGAALIVLLQSPHAYAADEPVPAGVFSASALGEEALEAQRGAADTSVLNSMRLAGTVGDNQAYNMATGMNLVTDGALSGNSGLSTIVQNSGSNVLIQNATIINVQMQ